MSKKLHTLIVSLFFLQSFLFAGGFPAAYYQIDDTAEQKEEFIRQMKVLADKSNEEILKDREFVTQFFAKAVPCRLVVAQKLRRFDVLHQFAMHHLSNHCRLLHHFRSQNRSAGIRDSSYL